MTDHSDFVRSFMASFGIVKLCCAMTKGQLQEKINTLTTENAALRSQNADLKARLKKYEIAEFMEAFRNSDKSYEEFITLLQG